MRPSALTRLAVPGAAISLLTLIVFFGIGLASSQSKARHEVVGRFSDHAAISAALTDSLFESSAAAARAANTKLYGGKQVSSRALSAAAARAGSLDLVLLESDGRI